MCMLDSFETTPWTIYQTTQDMLIWTAKSYPGPCYAALPFWSLDFFKLSLGRQEKKETQTPKNSCHKSQSITIEILYFSDTLL